jgi:large subunit ribosomal protein L24
MKKKQAPPPNRIRIKKGDIVRVITGRDAPRVVNGQLKTKEGRVLEVDHKRGRLLVEGVNMVKRHTRPNPARQVKGGIAERESSIHVSNVMLLTSGGVPTRVAVRVESAAGKTRRTRIARKTGEILDKKA